MEKYDQEYFKKVKELLEIRAEKLVEENNESVNREIVEIEIMDDLLQFVICLSIENYEYEEETNSASYDAEVTVIEVPKFEDKSIEQCFMAEFYMEKIY